MPLALLATVVYYALLAFFLLLWVRWLLDLVQLVARAWRPRGAVLVAAEAAYTVTDPPIRFFRRLLPPLRIGQVSLDLGFTVTMIAVIVAMTIVSGFAR